MDEVQNSGNETSVQNRLNYINDGNAVKHVDETLEVAIAITEKTLIKR